MWKRPKYAAQAYLYAKEHLRNDSPSLAAVVPAAAAPPTTTTTTTTTTKKGKATTEIAIASRTSSIYTGKGIVMHQKWNANYTALHEYVRANGGVYPNRGDLHHWCKSQRYRYTTTPQHGTMTPQMIGALERLPNWFWKQQTDNHDPKKDNSQSDNTKKSSSPSGMKNSTPNRASVATANSTSNATAAAAAAAAAAATATATTSTGRQFKTIQGRNVHLQFCGKKRKIPQQ